MRKNLVSPFIELIWDIVSDPSTDSMIAWNDNGTSFCIANSSLFAEQILTQNFKHANVSSFIRQLNMYNFHKNKNNMKQLEFFHKLFRRDARQLLRGIKRKPSEADHRQGQDMLRKFIMGKFDLKDQQYHDQSKQEGSEHTQNQPPIHLNHILRKQSAFSDQLERPNITISQFQVVQPPKKIINIILITRPSLE